MSAYFRYLIAILTEAYLGARARQVRTEHDNPRGLIIIILTLLLKARLKQLNIPTPTIPALLELDLVLYDERLALGVQHGVERRRDGVVRRFGFRHEPLVVLDRRGEGFFHGPFAYVGEGLPAHGRFLCGFGGSPARGPVVSELLKEGSLEGGGLWWEMLARASFLFLFLNW